MLEGSASSEEGIIDEARDDFLAVKYRHVDILEEDLSCVIKAAESGIFRHDSLIAKDIMKVHANNLDRAKLMMLKKC